MTGLVVRDKVTEVSKNLWPMMNVWYHHLQSSYDSTMQKLAS